ncbi:DUF429 domain-containing protein [Symmachiella dynata]|uniref:DUF429 domain-containing protein n=1 Tax=Symmachiella dynata TaxID=2527995 RepID=UPI00119EE8F2|nr:DUF429 domain-containing protein [Symmachiella dynata]
MNDVIYFFGCDMGGWHNTSQQKGDALAVCKWDGTQLEHVDATAAITFFPVISDQSLSQHLNAAKSDDAQIIVGIDAALSWPAKFTQLITEAHSFTHDFDFELTDSVNNPYLYRETERFIKRHVQTGMKERPLTAVGDKFGNNSSKAQALGAWFLQQLPDVYRPPFDVWDRENAKIAQHTLIEVYPAASMKSAKFKRLHWPSESQSMDNAGKSDIADAKRCAMTAFVYAASVGKLKCEKCPNILTPDDADELIRKSALNTEGWIFAPKCK